MAPAPASTDSITTIGKSGARKVDQASVGVVPEHPGDIAVPAGVVETQQVFSRRLAEHIKSLTRHATESLASLSLSILAAE